MNAYSHIFGTGHKTVYLEMVDDKSIMVVSTFPNGSSGNSIWSRGDFITLHDCDIYEEEDQTVFTSELFDLTFHTDDLLHLEVRIDD